MSAYQSTERGSATSLVIMIPAIFGTMALAAVLGFLVFHLLLSNAAHSSLGQQLSIRLAPEAAEIAAARRIASRSAFLAATRAKSGGTR